MRTWLVALMLVVLPACSASPDLPARPSGNGPADGSVGEVSRTRVGVPILTEYSEQEALRRVADRGLAARVVRRFEACRPAGTVVDQIPTAGTKVRADRRVTIVVANRRSEEVPCGEGVASEHDHDIAQAVYSFSRDPHGDMAPWAPRVTVLAAEGQARKTIAESRVQEPPRHWRFAAPYAQLSILDVLAGSAGEFRVDLGPHAHCAGSVRPPLEAFDGLRQISITPSADFDSCLDWWAVDLYVNDVGQIEGIVLERWEW